MFLEICRMIVDSYGRAFGGEAPRGRRADISGGSGYERDLAAQPLAAPGFPSRTWPPRHFPRCNGTPSAAKRNYQMLQPPSKRSLVHSIARRLLGFCAEAARAARGDVQCLRIYVRQLREKREGDPSRSRLTLTETGVGIAWREDD